MSKPFLKCNKRPRSIRKAYWLQYDQMVKIYKIGDTKEINSGEILEDEKDHFRVHSSNTKYDKSIYEYKRVP